MRQDTTMSDSGASIRESLTPQGIEITINVYDLLPPSKISTALWHLGTAILHSGLVIDNREYAYGGHNLPGKTGVYYTKPGHEPPGGTFRASHPAGTCYLSEDEIESVLREASLQFLGTRYNLLTRNCNHFTDWVCEKLTGKKAPAWLNRAAGVGMALPCVVPREWLAPPDYETAEGDLVDEEDAGIVEEEDDDERARMLRHEHSRTAGRRYSATESLDDGGVYDDSEMRPSFSRSSSMQERLIQARQMVKDTSGRTVPVSERAPVDST